VLLLLLLLLILEFTGGSLRAFEFDCTKSLVEIEIDLFILLFDAEYSRNGSIVELEAVKILFVLSEF
jgi:hypothetical protein